MAWFHKKLWYVHIFSGRFLLYILLVPLYIFSFFSPRKRNVWVFGAWWGDRYADNSRWLFEYVNRNHPEIRAIWITKKSSIVKALREVGYEAYHMYSFLGIYYSLRAFVGVVSLDVRDINIGTVGGMKIVQLWHGIPMKKIHFDTYIGKIADSFLGKLSMFLFPFMRRAVYYGNSMFIATSKHVAERMKSAFRVSSQCLVITGYPRNDVFFMKDKGYFVLPEESVLVREIRDKKKLRKRIVMYLPTHRREGLCGLDWICGENMRLLDQRLGELGCVLLIKLHYCHRGSSVYSEEDFENIVWIREKVSLDIYIILRYVDILITDYSSVYFDFLLLNRPVVFAPFDIDSYVKDRGLYYDYDSVTAGPKAKNWEEVLSFLEEVICAPDKYAEEREKLCRLFHAYRDGRSSERVFDGIQNFIHVSKTISYS